MLRILIAMQALVSTVAAQQYNKELVQAALVPKSKMLWAFLRECRHSVSLLRNNT